MAHLLRNTLNRCLNLINVSRNMCSISKELIKQQRESSPQINQDILFNTFKSAGSTRAILDLVNAHHTIMNDKHMMQALRSLFTLQKLGRSSLSTQQIIKSPDFELLCNRLKKHAGIIELNDTLEALKVVCYVGVQSDSTITQVLLQLLRHQVNNLSLHQLIFLDFLIVQMKPTPLSEALKIALPIVFEIQVQTKLDPNNLSTLVECLQYISKRNISERCIEYVIGCILKHPENLGYKNALSIVWSICDFEPDVFLELLLNKAVKNLIVHMDDLAYTEMDTTISKLVGRYSSLHPFYYNDIFFDMCGNYVIDNNLGFEYGIYMLRKYQKVQHANNKLIDYLSKMLIEDPSIIKKIEPNLIDSYIVGVSLTDYRPNGWDTIKNYLETTDIFQNSIKNDIYWLKLVSSLCILDIYKPDILDIAFRPTYIHKTIKRRNKHDFESMTLINQAIHLYRPEYINKLPDISLTNQLNYHRLRPVTDYPLEGALRSAFGGPQYVLTKVTSDLNHHIDHLIVLRDGGYPIALSGIEPYRLEDFSDKKNKMVAVLALNPYSYTINTKRMKASTLFTIKTLETLGCIVVPISIADWSALEDYEKIPYLMQAVRLKTNSLYQSK